ncbi:cell division control protein 1 [[Candida] anglica]|uniref:Cell division control protein 1 n=1 Tax=[Candida] anglica TaxID=148631 RepID=A0ABP0ELN6_9ASCO
MSYRRKEKSEDEVPASDIPAATGITPSAFTPKPALSSHSTTSKEALVARWSEILFSKLHWKALLSILLFWIVLIHHFERSVPCSAMKSCQWNNWEKWGKHAKPHRIAIIADPQLVDAHTYPEKPWVFNHFITRISDNFLHRNYKFMQSYIDPDTTIFLGDLFDGGREWKDAEWVEEYKRFNRIFPQKPNRRSIRSIPGNHDIGFQEIDKKVRDRFSAFFGEPNDYIEIGNHSIVLVDTISLSHKDNAINADAKEFLRTIDLKLNPQMPRILFSHVPLYRDNQKQLCGPLREKGDPFPLQAGKQYQTVLDHDVSQKVLAMIEPSVIFSGDDHDYCHIKHKYTFDGFEKEAEEISVKTASMTCGVKYPAIQLLSLHNPYEAGKRQTKDSPPSYKTKMCYMPSPYFALYSYIFFIGGSILFLALIFIAPKVLVSLVNKIPLGGSKIKEDSPSSESRWKFAPRLQKAIVEGIEIKRDVLAFAINTFVALCIIFYLFGVYGTNT